MKRNNKFFKSLGAVALAVALTGVSVQPSLVYAKEETKETLSDEVKEENALVQEEPSDKKEEETADEKEPSKEPVKEETDKKTPETKAENEKIINFPDEKLFNALLQYQDGDKKLDANGDGKISQEELNAVTYITLNNVGFENPEGLQYVPLSCGLEMSGNNIKDLSVFEERIKNNEGMNLRDNKITDFSLFRKYNADMYQFAIGGNPASGEEYMSLVNIPSVIYMSTGTMSLKGLSIHGMDDEYKVSVYNPKVLSVARVGTYYEIFADKIGDAEIIISCKGVEKSAVVHVGKPNATIKDVKVKDLVWKEGTGAKSIYDIFATDNAQWVLGNYTWSSSNEAVVKIENRDDIPYLVTMGSGTATIKGVPITRAGEEVSFTITVNKTGENPDDNKNSGTSGKNQTTDDKNNTKKPEISKSNTTPKTGDTSQLALLLGMFVVSGGYLVFRRRRA